MVAALLKKNTLEQTQFELTPEGFLYRGLKYAFSDVIETRSYRAIHQTQYVGMGVTTSHNPAMSFLLLMKDGEQVQVTEQSTWTHSSKQERVDQVQVAFDVICTQTFQQRAKRYTDQPQSIGYFEYGGWRFFPEQGKVIDSASTRAHAISHTQFLRSYGFIEIVPKNESIAAKFIRKAKQEFNGSRYGIGTLTDTDVFFALLAHYFRLQW